MVKLIEKKTKKAVLASDTLSSSFVIFKKENDLFTIQFTK